jgi:hypothetical protein
LKAQLTLAACVIISKKGVLRIERIVGFYGIMGSYRNGGEYTNNVLH